jgi:hypothetical protein
MQTQTLLCKPLPLGSICNNLFVTNIIKFDPKKTNLVILVDDEMDSKDFIPFATAFY